MTDKFDDRVLGQATGVGAPPPPPSADLLRAVDGMKPVRTRSRFGALALVALAGLVGPVVALVRGPFRRDWPGLPAGWVIAATALWGISFALSLAAALVPRRGDVLPAPSRASRVAAAAMAVLALFALFATVDVPAEHAAGRTWLDAVRLVPPLYRHDREGRGRVPDRGHRGAPARRSGRRVRVGMALGAAGGAAGGLLLVFICPFASAAHVTLGHVGGTVLAAIAGALLLAGVARIRTTAR
jgi:hypothetical protein